MLWSRTRSLPDGTKPGHFSSVCGAHFGSMCGPHFCSTKITQDARDYAAKHGIAQETAALVQGLREKVEGGPGGLGDLPTGLRSRLIPRGKRPVGSFRKTGAISCFFLLTTSLFALILHPSQAVFTVHRCFYPPSAEKGYGHLRAQPQNEGTEHGTILAYALLNRIPRAAVAVPRCVWR